MSEKNVTILLVSFFIIIGFLFFVSGYLIAKNKRDIETLKMPSPRSTNFDVESYIPEDITKITLPGAISINQENIENLIGRFKQRTIRKLSEKVEQTKKEALTSIADKRKRKISSEVSQQLQGNENSPPTIVPSIF